MVIGLSTIVILGILDIDQAECACWDQNYRLLAMVTLLHPAANRFRLHHVAARMDFENWEKDCLDSPA